MEETRTRYFQANTTMYIRSYYCFQVTLRARPYLEIDGFGITTTPCVDYFSQHMLHIAQGQNKNIADLLFFHGFVE